VPTLMLLTALARWLDRVDPRRGDSLGYLLVATK
jgi:hypothetical protein